LIKQEQNFCLRGKNQTIESAVIDSKEQFQLKIFLQNKPRPGDAQKTPFVDHVFQGFHASSSQYSKEWLSPRRSSSLYSRWSKIVKSGRLERILS